MALNSPYTCFEYIRFVRNHTKKNHSNCMKPSILWHAFSSTRLRFIAKKAITKRRKGERNSHLLCCSHREGMRFSQTKMRTQLAALFCLWKIKYYTKWHCVCFRTRLWMNTLPRLSIVRVTLSRTLSTHTNANGFVQFTKSFYLTHRIPHHRISAVP